MSLKNTNTFKTNYFAVKDNHAFEKFMASVGFTYENGGLWSVKTPNGSVYAFGNDGMELFDIICMQDYRKDECPNGDYEEPYYLFLKDLQKHIVDDDCIIIRTVGRTLNDGAGEPILRVYSRAMIVTPNDIQYVDFEDLLREKVNIMFGKDYNATHDDMRKV